MTTKRIKTNNESRARTAPQPVHFEFQDRAARKVCIAGTFNEWRPEQSEMMSMGSGKWVKDLDLGPGTYEYRFVVDGKWMNDPRCIHTIPNAFGETNSLLVVPDRKPSARAAQTKISQSAGPVPRL